MHVRFAVVIGMTLVGTICVCQQSKAQGSVAWSAGYAKGVNTVPAPNAQLGKFLAKGTQTPTPNWTFDSAFFGALNNAGGPLAARVWMNQDAGNLGKRGANLAIVELDVPNVNPGTYTTYLEVVFSTPNTAPGAPPGARTFATIYSPTSLVTIN